MAQQQRQAALALSLEHIQTQGNGTPPNCRVGDSDPSPRRLINPLSGSAHPSD